MPDDPIKPLPSPIPPPQPPLRVSPSLDEAARVMLSYLPPTMVELIDTLCKEHGVKPAAYLLSYCRLAHERGEIATYIENEVYSATAGPAPLLAPRELECAYCKKRFMPTRIGQRFCPDPDDGTPGCGRKNTLETMHAGREHYLQRTRPNRAEVNRVAAPRADNVAG